MKTIEIIYNPYKMKTKMLIDGVDVCRNHTYNKFKKFIDDKIPLQTWIEPIRYLDWPGLVNAVSDPEINDEVNVIFSGREIDFEDLKRSIEEQNKKREEETRVIFHYDHKKVVDDKDLSQDIEDVVKELKSDRFRVLVSDRTTEVTKKYNDLDKNYKIAKESVFYIVVAGIYNSGKSTLLNALIRHNILPIHEGTCTSKNCRIRHDSSLGTKVSLTCYDKDDKIVLEKRIYENDSDCAVDFLKICPIKSKDPEDKYPDVDMLELGVDLSHLYPDSVNEDKFTVVLIDTPGMASSESIENGTNKHEDIALEAVSMDSKPMIILCTDATYTDHTCIGEFMRKIVAQSREEGSGFNDRFLFLMNGSDKISYNQGETSEDKKKPFAKSLTDSSKWNIKDDEDELKQLAEAASHFVPRVFMTAGLIAFAIQCGALDFSDEELNDPRKEDLYKKLKDFFDKICGDKKRPIYDNYYLARYCDIPDYRKEEFEKEFQSALDRQDRNKAMQIQCGLLAVESAIRDYIARYAYPIKVRGLLDTFEDILEDVNGFTDGFLDDLKQAEKKLGETRGERKEASERKRGAKEKIAALKNAQKKIKIQQEDLDGIQFDSKTLGEAIGNFRADIEEDEEIVFIRNNPKVGTKQRDPSDVEQEINARSSNIKSLFERTLDKLNKKLEEIQTTYNGHIREIFAVLKDIVAELERLGEFEQGKYKFTDTVYWKKNFANIDTDKFDSDMKENVKEKESKKQQVPNAKKKEWGSSLNPIKKIASFFMKDYKDEIEYIDGYYETTKITKSIDAYYQYLETASKNMLEESEKILESSKEIVRDKIKELLQEMFSFYDDIKKQEACINDLGGSEREVKNKIKDIEETLQWLNKLKEKIKGE